MNTSVFKRVSLLRFGGAHQRTRDIKEFYDTVTKPGQAPIAGRAWSASELRQKSFSDLHKLWFVMLKEKNMLLTERLQARTTGQAQFRNPMRLRKVKLGMARIKVVLSERSRAYEAAKQQVRVLYEKARQEDNASRRARHVARQMEKLALKKAESESSTAESIIKGETETITSSL